MTLSLDSDVDRFRQILGELQTHPRMFVLDDGYVSLVAFIDGLALGTDGGVLDGFREWLVREVIGTPDSRHWSVLVASRVSHDVREGRRSLAAMSAEEQAHASAELFTLLMRYLRVG